MSGKRKWNGPGITETVGKGSHLGSGRSNCSVTRLQLLRKGADCTRALFTAEAGHLAAAAAAAMTSPTMMDFHLEV